MYEKLLKTVTNLGSPRILLVGDFMLDVYIYGDALRISPEAPVPVLKVKEISHACGGAASVAINLLTLGAKVTCIGTIGCDDNAKILKKLLSDKGADIDSLIETPNKPTITKQRLVGLAQHRHRQQLMRIDTECTDLLSNDICEKAKDTFTKVLNNCDIVCLQDYNKSMLTPNLCKYFIDAARQAGKKLLIDPAFNIDYTKYMGATLITPNRKETSAAVGFEVIDNATAEKAAKILCEDLKLDAVVITLDKEGAYLHCDEKSELIPTRIRKVYDVTGAGDMVLAALAVTIAAECDYETSVQICNIAGGIEVEKFGVAPVSVYEIVNEIIAENHGASGKIRTIDSITQELNWHRNQGRKIVFTNGCFDIIHPGHVEYLSFCKKQGDVVVLGLNSDSSVKQLKGPERPVNNQHDRAAVLAGLESIDYIVIFDELDPLNTIKKVKPNILVKGKDWEDKGVIGGEFVKENGGKVIFAPLVEGKSSTATIEKLKSIKDSDK